MFTNIMATGEYAWAPSQGLNSNEDGYVKGEITQ